MIRSDAINAYAQIARNVLMGNSIDVGFFGSLSLPHIPNNVSLVVMNGPLSKADICGAEGSRTLANKINEAAANSAIDAILVLSENCPGGQVDGTQLLADAIAAAKTQKPVYGAVSGMACSAAYFAISQCTQIFATSSTDIIGCIGTMATVRNPKSAADEDFIEIVSDYSPDKNKEFADPKKLKTAYLNPVTTIFHNYVKNGRGTNLKLDKENVLSGAIYISDAALENGLIDGVMPFEQIIEMAAGKKNINKPKKYTMAFDNTLKAAAATEFQVVDGGFLLEETHLNAIEATLSNHAELAASNGSLTTANNELSNQLQAEQQAHAATTQQLTDAQQTNATLQAEVERLRKGDPKRLSNAAGGGDPVLNNQTNEEFLTEVDAELARYQAY